MGKVVREGGKAYYDEIKEALEGKFPDTALAGWKKRLDLEGSFFGNLDKGLGYTITFRLFLSNFLLF